jgi:hypothetical protein
MPPIIEGPPDPGEPPRPLGAKLGWFVALWIASLCVVAAITYSLRALIL